MDTNPYQSPQTDRHVSDTGRGSALHVDGKYLVVPTGTVLPSVCVKTNQPASQADMVQKTLLWCPQWAVILLVLLTGPLVLLVLMLLAKRCKIIYGLAPELRRRRRTWSIVAFGGVIMMLLPFAILFGAPAFGFLDLFAIGFIWLIAGTAAAMLGGFVATFVSAYAGREPLNVRKHHQGRFWVEGCSAEYLADIETEATSGRLGTSGE